MPDRAAADKFEPGPRRGYPPRGRTARVTRAAPKAMATLGQARADSSLLDAPQAMAFSFVHTLDVHLDSPLATLPLCDPVLADVIGGAAQNVFFEALT